MRVTSGGIVGTAAQHPRIARVVPSIRRRVAREEDGRTERRADQGEEKRWADRFLVVDSGCGSSEDLATLTTEERAIACRAADHTLAVSGQLVRPVAAASAIARDDDDRGQETAPRRASVG